MKLRAISICLAFGFGNSVASQQPLSTPEIAQRATASSVTVLTIGARGDTVAQGSGFVARADGIVVTNWHVLRGGDRAAIVFPNGDRFVGTTFLGGDSVADVVILKIAGAQFPALTMQSGVPPVGARIVVIGSPFGLERTISEGIVSALRSEDGRDLIQMSAPISPGSSGGPVLDQYGAVVGITRSTIRGAQQLNFAVPIRYALELIATDPSPRSLSSVFGSGKGIDTAADLLGVSSPELLRGITTVYVSIEWRTPDANSIRLDTAVLRNTIEAELRRVGLRVSRDSRVLGDTGVAEIRLGLTSFVTADKSVAVTALDLRCLDVGVLRRVPDRLAVLPIWDSGVSLRISPAQLHQSVVTEAVRYLLDLLANSYLDSKR